MRKKLIYGLIFLVVLVVGGALAFAIFQPVKVLPRIRLAPGFALTDQNNALLTNEDMRGKIVVYAFTYTRCVDPCRSTTPTLQELQPEVEALDTGGIPIRFVTISVDHVKDNPAALNDFAAAAGAHPDLWKFVGSSDPVTLKNVVGGGFEVYFEAQNPDVIKLDPVFMLVDGLGIIRGEYRYTSSTPDAERLMRHIQVLVEEAHNSKGAAKLAYEAAHLFMCYAP